MQPENNALLSAYQHENNLLYYSRTEESLTSVGEIVIYRKSNSMSFADHKKCMFI